MKDLFILYFALEDDDVALYSVKQTYQSDIFFFISLYLYTLVCLGNHALSQLSFSQQQVCQQPLLLRINCYFTLFKLLLMLVQTKSVMIDSILLENPYEKIYRCANPIKQLENLEEAQTLIKHLGLMYNTFGLAIKDFVKLVSTKFQAQPLKNQPFQVKTNEHKYNRQSQSSKESKPTQDKQGMIENIKAEKMCSTQHPVPKRSSLTKNAEIRFDNNTDERSSQNSEFSVTSHHQKGAITRAGDFSCNNFQLQFQMVPNRSPKKEEQIDKDMNFQMFQLSHKQRLKDPSFIVVEQDQEHNSTGKKYESPFANIEPIKPIGQREPANFDFDGEIEEQEDSMMRQVGGRKKKDREKLKGISCLECEKYYKIMQIEGKDICDCTSRHRSNRPAKKLKNKFTQDFDLK